jgi:hypothetical protein
MLQRRTWSRILASVNLVVQKFEERPIEYQKIPDTAPYAARYSHQRLV